MNEPFEATKIWEVAGRSIRGSTHTRQGKPCQDAILWDITEDAVILAVADGHGSDRSPKSDLGAHLAVETAIEILGGFRSGARDSSLRLATEWAKDQLPRLIVRTWSEKVRNRNQSLPGADEQRHDLRTALLEYGSTLMAVLVSSDFLLYLQLGDGDILVVEEDSSVTKPILHDERHFANETTSLCSDHAWNEMRVVVVPSGRRAPPLIVVSTDGYSNSFTTEPDFLQAGPDFLELIREEGWNEVVSRLEEWLVDASSQGSGDDITVGLIHRKDTAPGQEVTPATTSPTEITRQSP
jgi:hypothetical protein